MNKEYDLLINMLGNPEANIAVLREAGISANNTGLKTREEYLKDERIKTNQNFLNDKGLFDEEKFNSFYKTATNVYNLLADDTYVEDFKSQLEYHREDIFAPKESKRDLHKYGTKEVWIANPYRLRNSLDEFGQRGVQTLTEKEIAESQKVLLNPVAVQNGATPEWGDSLEDSFWGNLFNTNVVATWDYDADINGNKATREEDIYYRKGERKLNEKGTFYVERLDGRPVYEKEVISKWDTLTTEGSFWNQYDFFDSDDLKEKHWFGTLMREAVFIAPMFIPGFGQWYAGLYLAANLGKVFSTVGKMITGSDNKSLNQLEGFLESWSTRTTQEAQESFMNFENIITMLSDVVSLGKSQRLVFKTAPALFKGNKFLNKSLDIADDKIDDLQKVLQKGYMNQNLASLTKGTPAYNEALLKLKDSSKAYAKLQVNDIMKQYNVFGEKASRAYMTATVSRDMYNEAKRNGASDLEATLFTLGYGAGEYVLLGSDVARWILPEYRATKMSNKKIFESIAGSLAKVETQAEKSNAFKKILKKGYDAVRGDYLAGTGNTVKSAFHGAINEGVEETFEELLADFSRLAFDGLRSVRGEEKIMNAFDNYGEKYLQTFFGGALGGGVLGADLKFKGRIPTSEQAMQELVYMARNGKLDKVRKDLEKFNIGDKNKSFKAELDDDGNIIYGDVKGKDDMSQQEALKKMIGNVIDTVETVINDNSLNKSDNQLLNGLKFRDEAIDNIKSQTLLQAVSLKGLMQGYNNLGVKASNVAEQIKQLQIPENRQKLINEGKDPDNEIDKLKDELKKINEEAESYISGKKNADTIRNILFETMTGVSKGFLNMSFQEYVEKKTGKSFDSLTEAEKNNLNQQYEDYKNTQYIDDVDRLSKLFVDFIDKLSQDDDLKVLLKTNQTFDNEFINKISNGEFSKLQEIYKKQVELHDFSSVLNSFDLFDLDTNIQNIKSFIKTLSENESNTVVKNIVISNLQSKLIDEYNNQISVTGSAGFELEDLFNELKTAYGEISLKDSLDFKVNYLLFKIGQMLGSNVSYNDATESISKYFNNLSNLKLSDNEINHLMQISQTIEILKNILEASKTDNASVVHKPFGFNSILNRINGTKLLEIDSKQAEYLIASLDAKNAEMQKILELNRHNSGLKSKVQEQIHINKSILTFKRLNTFVENLEDKDFEGLTELKLLLNDSEILKELSKNKTLDLTEEQLEKLEEELLKIDEAIYNIYQKNNLLNDSDKLAKFISSINIYSNTNSELDENSDIIDETVFLNYLTTRGTLNRSEFLQQFYDTIPNHIMPLSTHEEAIYMNYASFLSKENSLFKKTIDVVRKRTLDEINLNIQKLYSLDLKDVDEAKEYFKTCYKLSKDDFFNVIDNKGNINDTLLKENIAGSISSLPFYKNITLIEGVSGSGKTSVVIGLTVTMIEKYHPNKLNKFKITHITKKAGEDLLNEIKKINLNTKVQVEVLTKEDLLEEMTGDKNPTLNPDGTVKDNVVKIPKPHIIKVNGNEVGIQTDEKITYDNINLCDTDPVYEILVIDEISRFNGLEIDIINDYSEKHGITTFVAGDFDQTSQVLEIPFNKQGYNISLEPKRNMFVRTSKFGTSMRTRNSQKSKNNKSAQMLVQEKTNTLDLFNYTDPQTGEIKGDFFRRSCYI